MNLRVGVRTFVGQPEGLWRAGSGGSTRRRSDNPLPTLRGPIEMHPSEPGHAGLSYLAHLVLTDLLAIQELVHGFAGPTQTEVLVASVDLDKNTKTRQPEVRSADEPAGGRPDLVLGNHLADA